MNLKGGSDLTIVQGQHFGQLGDQHPLRTLIVARVASGQIAIQEDGALIIGIDHFQSLSQQSQMIEGVGGIIHPIQDNGIDLN
jgi:hypothetical protein